MIIQAPDFRVKVPPFRVFLTWDITYKCNYKCSYCHYGGAPDAGVPPETAHPGVGRWIEIWEDIRRRYGSCQIHIVGGEPFHYPGFMELIIQLSQMHTWECSTNLSWDPDELIRRVSPGRARIGVSFHPEFVDFDTFFAKAKKLKDAGFEVWANYVSFPTILKGMDVCKKKFADAGISMSILPFKGEHNGKQYPDAFTDDERAFLRSLGTEPWVKKTLDFTFDKQQQKNINKSCRMGQMYAKIYSNGDAYNCCVKSAVKLGNLIDGTFKLLEEPYICREETCPCWKCMLVDNQSHWVEHWVVPPDARLRTENL
jgi:MoaA/NifB/PqqE/SkfB family radical SAM enzyme